MKKTSLFVSAGCLLALFAGCRSASTTATRIQEKSAEFAALPAVQQKQIKSGMVEVGYTADMVYVALGHPSKVSVTPDGLVGIWTYRNYVPTETFAGRSTFAPRPTPHEGERTTTVPSTGPAAPGTGMTPGTLGVSSRGPSERTSNESFANWSESDYVSLTLHVMFTHGRVSQVTLDDGNS